MTSIDKFFKNSTPEKLKVTDYYYKGKILSKNNKDSLAIIDFKTAYSMDTTDYDILSDIAASYNKLKKYDEAARYYELKISKPSDRPRFADQYKLGLVYYNLKNWVKADSAYSVITRGKGDFMNGKAYYWRGLINANIYSASVTWQAKPYFEKYAEMIRNDSVKLAKDLITCYDYFASYYFLGPDKKICEARKYWEKIVALDDKNERALGLLKETKGIKCPDNK
jgi:tetratricopeptide (TPR) repeat protein